MKIIVKTALSAAFLLMIGLFLHQGESISAEVNKHFSEPVDQGSPIRSVAVYDSAYGTENGKDIMYTTASGNPAIFQVVDLENQEVLRTYTLEGSSSSWTHITVPNGNVYIGGNGSLYEYSPETQEVKNLDGIGESVVYGLSYDEEGRVYFGSYPNAKAGMYDPNTGEMRDYGSVAPGQSYTRSTAYHDGYLYLGVGTDNRLAKLDVETGEYETIEFPDHVVHGSSVWQLDAAGKYIVAGVGGGENALLFYDTEAEEWSDTYYLNNKGLRLVDGQPGSNKAYFLQNNRLQEIDLETLEKTDTGVVFGTFLRNTSWVEVPNDPDFPGLSLVTVHFGGEVTYMNLETKKVKTIAYPIVGNPIPLQTMEKGPDGKLYLSGYPGGKAAVFNPETGESEDFSLGQAEGMASIGDKMYFGVYPGATIFELDTANSELDPKQIYDIPNQDRPFVMTPVGKKLFIGTIPDYGKLGGSLTVLDSDSPEDTAVYENVVHNQSIAGLAEKDGKLYGSTTVAGGLGINPTESEAKLFVWDINAGEKIEEFVPEIPGVTVQPDMISGTSVGPDGLIWAAADGTIFAMNPDTLEIVKSKNIYPEVTGYGNWRPVHIRWGEDGLMYTTLAGNITVIDPETLEYETLAETELMTLGDDGNIYYADGPKVMKIEVTEKVTHEDALDVIHEQTDDGNIVHSLSKKLINKINQAIHHRDDGRLEQSEKFTEDALKHLNKAKPSDITADAKAEIERLLNLIDF
ncbi:WD40 repeat domain-containing protein [Virgibacillus indicus]|uniref:FIMAH domain-containing protein n=1 Tax=Virgibacillus indicus TaxID=2024554 RepID=UPI00197E50B6|nr:WD40 repeat domain-containing protein [Virgibacillus indicus]